ncbi:shwachman-Bodian-Diamond syndrome protein [Halarchaeum acidiphilum MH1-52-1]|uniref:Shwachman-Bodian-Diamond syndrome protein n=2 Tax=Halarchaeum acidiphilum TaxID=489138 RepID=U2YFR2_9EURY|nr:shwachman-Bodian-Diamond syndrome protein [Halarchaeum acidiphilum MH1-52-1]
MATPFALVFPSSHGDDAARVSHRSRSYFRRPTGTTRLASRIARARVSVVPRGRRGSRLASLGSTPVPGKALNHPPQLPAMISLDEAVTARLESHGERFEVLVDPDAALAIKRGEFDGELEDVIAARDVFENASRGDRPAEEDLETVFETTDPMEIIPEVIEEGEIQITAEQREEMQERKRRQLINTIARNAVNPQMDNAPHPPERIESALEQAGFTVDPMEPVEAQIDDALDALRPVIPIRFEEVTVAVSLPADYAGSGQAQIREFGELEREEWQSDGSWVGVLTFPAGMRNELYDLVAEVTSGEGETRVIKDKDELSTR